MVLPSFLSEYSFIVHSSIGNYVQYKYAEEQFDQHASALYQPSKGGLPTSKICVFLAVSRVKASMIIFNYHSTGLNVPL